MEWRSGVEAKLRSELSTSQLCNFATALPCFIMKKEFLTDRISGIVLLLIAIWYVWEGSRLEPFMIADNLGPSRFPVILGSLLGVLSIVLILRPEPLNDWPTEQAAWVKMGLILASILIYAQLIVPLEFLVSTTLVMIALALVFGGPPLKVVLSCSAFSIFIFWLFSSVLKLGLPTGTIFEPLLAAIGG